MPCLQAFPERKLHPTLTLASARILLALPFTTLTKMRTSIRHPLTISPVAKWNANYGTLKTKQQMSTLLEISPAPENMKRATKISRKTLMPRARAPFSSVKFPIVKTQKFVTSVSPVPATTTKRQSSQATLASSARNT